MKPLYPNPPAPHQQYFPREFKRDVKPRPDPMRRIDFHDQPHKGDRVVWLTCKWIIGLGLAYCTVQCLTTEPPQMVMAHQCSGAR